MSYICKSLIVFLLIGYKNVWITGCYLIDDALDFFFSHKNVSGDSDHIPMIYGKSEQSSNSHYRLT